MTLYIMWHICNFLHFDDIFLLKILHNSIDIPYFPMLSHNIPFCAGAYRVRIVAQKWEKVAYFSGFCMKLAKTPKASKRQSGERKAQHI